jgi:predicted transcriptional regulator
MDEEDSAALTAEELRAIEEWQIAAIEEGIAAAERGELIPHEEVQAWVESWGSEHELPCPSARRWPKTL